MAYDKEKLTTVGQIEKALQKSVDKFADKEDVEKLEEQIEEIEKSEGDSNKIESISVNGEVQEIDEDKNVNIKVPTNVSELENDSGYQTEDEVKAIAETAVADISKLTMKVVDEVPDAAEAEEEVFYLVPNEEDGGYDVYILIDGEMVLLDNTTIDLTDYVTDEALQSALEAALENYYTKQEVDEALEGMLTEDDIISDEDFEEMLDSIFGE